MRPLSFVGDCKSVSPSLWISLAVFFFSSSPNDSSTYLAGLCVCADDGLVYSWGCCESGQLGHDSDESIAVPRVIEALAPCVVAQAACGEQHTVVITSTPWNAPHPELVHRLLAERHEFDLKQSMKRAIYRSDLVQFRQATAVRTLRLISWIQLIFFI